MRLNLKRARSLSARGLHGLRSKFGSNLKRAHPPIPPRGRALKLRPRKPEARASSSALEVSAEWFLPGRGASLGSREHHPSQTDFVSRVRTRPRVATWRVWGRPGRTGGAGAYKPTTRRATVAQGGVSGRVVANSYAAVRAVSGF